MLRPSRTARPRQAVAVCWYSPAAWVRLKGAVPDPERLAESHARWLEMVNSVCADLADTGVEVLRIEVDPDELLTWCSEQGRPADAAARAYFTAEKLRQRDRRGMN